MKFIAGNKNMVIKLNNCEKEVIILKAVLEIINSMVNYEVLDLIYRENEVTQIMFDTTTQREFFNIILVDFLSKADGKTFGINNSYLIMLKNICEDPNFNKNSISTLLVATNEFHNWLEQEVEFNEVWFPYIAKKINLKLKRNEFIEICGNICKHNFTRLTRQSSKIQDIFKKNGLDMGEIDSLLIIKEFFDQFHTNVFAYLSSYIADFLNNIRWGIYDYLRPEFSRSIIWESDEPPIYRYSYPEEIKNPLAKSYYWDLMNDIKRKPYMPKFKINPSLKELY